MFKTESKRQMHIQKSTHGMIYMNGHKKILAIIALAGLLIMAAPGALFTVQGDEGGSDGDIKIYGEAGGSGEKPWNMISGLVLEEAGTKSDEPFNVTVCEGVKWNAGESKYTPWGYIYGDLEDIVWTDDPEPSFTISQSDFDAHKEDAVNLTVYILGEYWREGPGEDELRQAYKDVKVQRPNHAPKAVAMITNSDENDNGMWDNWTTISNNDHGEVVYYIDSEGLSIKFYLNASASTDEDGDDITDVRWDLDGDGQFGAESSERKMNTTRYLGEGDHTLGLIVGDGNKYSEPVLDIKIVVRQPIRYPDLTIQNVDVTNTNLHTEIKKGDLCKVMAHVKNLGDNETSTEPFDVYFEYWFRDTSPDEPFWEELGVVTISETISVNGLKLVETPWDTGIGKFFPGVYSFRATVDYNDDMKELREQNNVFPAEGEEMSAENITLEEDDEPGDPDISIVEVTQSKTDAWVNEPVWINITLKNEGTGDARFVDIYYYVDNSYQHYRTIDNLPDDGSEVTTAFVFSGDVNNTSGFKIKLEVRDDGVVVETSDTLTVYVEGDPGGTGGTGTNDPPEDEEGGLNENVPIIIVAVVVIGGLGGAGFFFMRKKDEDVW